MSFSWVTALMSGCFNMFQQLCTTVVLGRRPVVSFMAGQPLSFPSSASEFHFSLTYP
jgi:hypothetical protein